MPNESSTTATAAAAKTPVATTAAAAAAAGAAKGALPQLNYPFTLLEIRENGEIPPVPPAAVSE
jgi:hypothetical protein